MDETLWVYLRSESQLYTVGFYEPSGKWQPESDHRSPEEAAARVHYLNGGTECGQPDRDAKILAESNIELLEALKHCSSYLGEVYVFLSEIEAKHEMSPDRCQGMIALAEAAIKKHA